MLELGCQNSLASLDLGLTEAVASVAMNGSYALQLQCTCIAASNDRGPNVTVYSAMNGPVIAVAR